MGLPAGLNLSSTCVLFGTPTTPGQYVNVYLDVSNYVVRSLALPTRDAIASQAHARLTIAVLAAPIHRAVRHQCLHRCPPEPASKPASEPVSAESDSPDPVASQPASEPAASPPYAPQPSAEPASSQPAAQRLVGARLDVPRHLH